MLSRKQIRFRLKLSVALTSNELPQQRKSIVVNNITSQQMSEKKENKEEAKPKETKIYTYQDLIQFSGTEIYSAFGEMIDSVKPSAPKFSFGTSVRDAEPKKYTTKEMADIDCFGKATPQGPNYNVSDKFNYGKSPTWKMGTQPRNTLDTKAKYEHYFRPDVDVRMSLTKFDVNEADKSRRFQLPNTRIGGQPRFPPDQKKYKLTPGPQYNPNLRPEIPKNPDYSLYARRSVKGFDPLIQLNSTPPIVGPGSYHPENSSNKSHDPNKPHWSIPKAPRMMANRNKWDLNQTYDTSSSVGVQPNSMKTSMPHFSTGKETRDNPRGIFKEHMEFKAAPVRISHPKW